jgi:K+-transporting ATPase ATPase C chain
MLAQIRPALVTTLFFILLLGLGYPLLVTAIAGAAFPAKANGSLIRDGRGEVIGSALLGQNFSRPQYLHPRPSAAGAGGYDASASAGSNLGPLNPVLARRIARDAASLAADGPGPIPADALTTSGSGLDPDISPANARRQAGRVAQARGIPIAEVDRIIAAATTAPWLGVFGQPRVNVLKANLDLDAARTAAHPGGR